MVKQKIILYLSILITGVLLTVFLGPKAVQGVTVGGQLDMSNNKIINVGAGTSDNDVAIYSQILSSAYWTQAGSNLYPKYTTWNVGIGTTAPAEKLQVQGGILRLNSRANSGLYPVGRNITDGETMFAIDPTWSDAELQKYFNCSNVAWNNDPTAPAGYAILITGACNPCGSSGSGFPYIPIENDGVYYMEVWAKGSGTTNNYMGSDAFNESFTHLGGNGGTYGYWVMAGTGVPGSWTKYSGYITGFGVNSNQFPASSKYWTPMALFNYSGGGNLYISGWKVVKVTTQGNRYFLNGNVGINTTDASSFKLQVAGNVGPNASASYDIGSSALKWKDAYFSGTVTAGGFSGPVSGAISAPNVSSGAFGANTGGGNYSFPGNVGIGTTAPLAAYKLDTRTAYSYTNADQNGKGIVFFGSNDASGPLGIGIYHSGYGSRYHVGITGTRYGISGNDIDLNSDDGAGGMTIQYRGNVGIGTTGPNQKLEVSGNIRLTSMDSKLEIGGANHVLSYGGTSYSGGSYYVTQLGDISNRIFIGVDRYNGNTSGSFHGNEIVSRGRVPWMVPNAANNGYVGIWGAGASDQIFIGNWGTPYEVENGGAVTILSSGNVGIGTTDPSSFKLQVAGSVGPNASASYDIGSSGLKWKDAYFSGTVTAGGFSGPVSGAISAPNVSSGAFGANTGGGNYSFPANVGIGTAGPNGRLEVGNGSDAIVISQINGDNTNSIQSYIDGQWANRASYASGCCNMLYIQKDAGDLTLGNSRGITVVGTVTAPTFSGNLTGNVTGAASLNVLKAGDTMSGRLNFGTDGAAPYSNPTGLSSGMSFGGWESSLRAYGIFTELENVGGNYSKLTLNWHTGIRIGAYYGYGGIRFYDNYAPTGNMVFSVANGDSNVRVTNNLLVGGNVGIGTANPISKLANTASNIADDYSGVSTDGISWYLATTDKYAAAIQNDTIYGGGLLIKAGNDKNATRRLLNVANGDNTSRLIVKGDGNIGIGTTNPSSFKLQVAGSVGPNANASYDIGSSALKWKDAYFSGTVTAGGFSGPVSGAISAPNVSSGSFGANTGGGNYSFPATVTAPTFSGTATNLANFSVAYGVNPDTKGTTGIHYFVGGATSPYGDGALYQQAYLNAPTTWGSQIMQDYRTGRLAVRGLNNTTWTTWLNIIDSGNIGAQSVNYANSAGSAGGVPWSGVTGKPTTFPSDAHDHYYTLGTYTGGGAEAPSYFGSNKLKLQMLYVGSWSWSDTLWMSSYAGGDVKGSNQLVFSKYGPNAGFRRQDFDSGTWGTLYEFIHSGNIGSQSVNYAASAGNADTVDSHHFNWSGQSGQPTWLWGGNDSANMYVYNPSNFSVSYAASAATAVRQPSSGDYVWSAVTTAKNLPGGITNSFVRSADGFPDYGTLINARSYSGDGGGGLQLYVPYGSSYGGTALRYRMADYSANPSDPPWTAFKTIIDSGNISSQTVSNSDMLDSYHYNNLPYLSSAIDNWVNTTGDTMNGNLVMSGDIYTTYGPNSSWASYLRVGGNGRTVAGDSYASVVTTNGNLHLDAGNTRAIYLNYYAGTAGIVFGNGASGSNASVSAAGVYTGTSLNVGSGAITSGLINGQTISSAANFTGTARVATALYLGAASNYLTANAGYLSLVSAGNEMTIGGSATMYINYRAAPGTTVTNYIWNAGTGTSWASHNMGNLTVNGSANATQLCIAGDCKSAWPAAGGVSSVFGRTGAVVAASGDYTTTQVTEGTNLYFTAARVADKAPLASPTFTGNVTMPGTGIWNSSGNVGIGTVGPSYKLDVRGTAGFNTTIYGDGKAVAETGDTFLRLNQSNQFSTGVWLGTSDLKLYTSHLYVGSNGAGSGNVDIYGNGDATNRITINGSTNANSWFNTGGNVGIGTTNPGTNKLEVVGGPIKATGGLIIEARTTNPASPVDGQIWVCVDAGYDCQ